MVSIWPTVNPNSENYTAMRERGYLVKAGDRRPLMAERPDKGAPSTMAYYDATNPEARRFLWGQVREHYYRHGIRVWWLDACEPDYPVHLAERAHYAAGDGLEVGNLYPKMHAQGLYEGMLEQAETEIVLLIRAAWAGSQRFATALWSGDIASTFASLATQIRAGLNVAMSGIPWWTTDIGGFHGGDPDDPHYRELFVRWFQYGVFCPLLRVHGDREPRTAFTADMTGGPNEVWSYGEEVYEILREHVLLRERLRPYLMDQMAAAHQRGAPPMRPLFFDFPTDPRAWTVEDQFMFGPDVLVAPVTTCGARERQVYLPAGTRWLDAWTDQASDGGATVTAAAPLEHIPVYLRAGSTLRLA
jgi:alpha-D-xyloside xylohydrolase